MATHPELVSVAKALQETAQTLLALSETSTLAELKEQTDKAPALRDDGETRSFYFPPSTVNMERELLRKHRADDFQGLLEEVHTLLAGLVKLMQSVHRDVRVRGYVIASLGMQLEHASSLVLRMRNIYDKVIPLQN